MTAKRIRVNDIAELLYKQHNQDPRPLHIQKCYSEYGRLGTVFFALEGSPPRIGFYLPQKCRLLLISSSGRMRRRKVIIEDLGEFPDKYTLRWH